VLLRQGTVAKRQMEMELVMLSKRNQRVDWEPFLAGMTLENPTMEYTAKSSIFAQGEPADSVFYLRRGEVKLGVTSEQGREAIVALVGDGEFFGEGCLAGQALRIATATAMIDCTVVRIEKPLMVRMLHEHHGASELFVRRLLGRNLQYEADLVAQLFNSSEKRLARILLQLAHFGKESRAETIVLPISQESLAQMLGLTESQVAHFMDKFKELGFIDYSDGGELTVRNGLLSMILHD
jgi:CRP/FNR family cyclic AMP-dependent transcriptional regulator